MTVFLTFATAILAGWIIDRLAFNGDLTAMIRDEISTTWSRRKRPSKAPRTARRGAGAR
jgi:hypothetical protein